MKTASEIIKTAVANAVAHAIKGGDDCGTINWQTTEALLQEGPITAEWLTDLYNSHPHFPTTVIPGRGEAQDLLRDLVEDFLMEEAGKHIEAVLDGEINIEQFDTNSASLPQQALGLDNSQTMKPLEEIVQDYVETVKPVYFMEDFSNDDDAEAHEAAFAEARSTKNAELSKGFTSEWLIQTLTTNPEILDAELDGYTVQDRLFAMFSEHIANQVDATLLDTPEVADEYPAAGIR